MSSSDAGQSRSGGSVLQVFNFCACLAWFSVAQSIVLQSMHLLVCSTDISAVRKYLCNSITRGRSLGAAHQASSPSWRPEDSWHPSLLLDRATVPAAPRSSLRRSSPPRTVRPVASEERSGPPAAPCRPSARRAPQVPRSHRATVRPTLLRLPRDLRSAPVRPILGRSVRAHGPGGNEGGAPVARSPAARALRKRDGLL